MSRPVYFAGRSAFSTERLDQNLICTSFLPLKWRHYICPVQNMSFRSASDHHVQVTGKIVQFVPLGYLQLRVSFGFLDNFSASLLHETSFMERFVKRILPNISHNVATTYRPVANISEYTTKSHLLDVLQTDPCASRSIHKTNITTAMKRTLFGLVKCLMTPPNTEACVSVRTNIARIIYMAPYTNLKQNQMVLPAFSNVEALLHAAPNVRVTGFEKISDRITLLYDNRVGTDLPDVIVQMDKPAMNHSQEREQKAGRSITNIFTAIHHKERSCDRARSTGNRKLSH